MKKNYLIAFMALATCPCVLQAKVIDPNKARTIATQYINIGTRPQMKAFKVQGNNKSVQAPDFYVFNDKSGQGFVLVAGDDCVSPVLGYSHNGKADADNMPPALKAWLESVSRYISYQRGMNGGVAKTYSAKVADNPGTPVVEPLVKTSWSQSEPYFNQTPTIDGQQTLTCCVATAMAQVFNYYKYPAHGTGVLDYATQYDQDRINIDLSKSTYDWDNMLDNYTTADDGTKNWNDAQAAAVSTLMRDVGAALHVMYGISGSGAYTEDIRTAAAHNFGYMATTYYKTNYSMRQWTEMLCKRFDEGNPVVITGVSKSEIGQSSGHAFVGDGYDSNANIHINWGWAGEYDGYYNFYNLGPDDNNFNSSMDFTEFSKDESGEAAQKIEQPVINLGQPHIIDGNGKIIGKSAIRMDADKFNAGITMFAYYVSWDKYDGRLKMGLYDEDGNNMLGTVGEERILKNDLHTPDETTDRITFQLKPEELAGLEDGSYQLVVLSNNTDGDNWVKADNDYILGIEKSDGSIILTISTRDTGHLTQKGELKFSKDTYSLGDIATLSVDIANNSNKDFGGEIYAHFQNVDKKEDTNDVRTGLTTKLFSGDEAKVTEGGSMQLTSRNGFNPGTYKVALWQYSNGKPVYLLDSKPATISIVENPKTQPTMYVKKMALIVNDEETEINPGDILNLEPSLAVVDIYLEWEKAEVEPENFSTNANLQEKIDDERAETIVSHNYFNYDALFDGDQSLSSIINGFNYETGSTSEFYVTYDPFSVAGNYLLPKYLGTDKNVSFKIHWTDEPTDIRNLNSTCTKVVERWNAQGVKLSKAVKGLNIVKYSDGSIRKEIVK